MDLPLSSASKRTQIIAGCFLSVPWLLIGIVELDLLPRAWQFNHWPELLRGVSVLASVLFGFANILFAFWYFLALAVDAYGKKS
jgi:hypothetical protein